MHLESPRLQEENCKKLAAATLIELKLHDDLSERNAGFSETLSQLSKDSHEQQSARVNDWVNNSLTLISATNQRAPEAPVIESNQEQTVTTQPLPLAASPSENATGSSPTIVTVQNDVPPQTENTTAPAPLSLTTTDSLNLPIYTFAGLPGQVPCFPGETSSTATSSAGAGLSLNNASILPQPCSSMKIASAPKTAQPRSNPIVTLPVNHILPNLSAWTFPIANTSQ